MKITRRFTQVLARLVVGGVLTVAAAAEAKETTVSTSKVSLEEFLQIQANSAESSKTPLQRQLAMTAASKPVVWNTNALNIAAVRQRRKAFLERQYLESFLSKSKVAPTQHPSAVRYLSNWIARCTGDPHVVIDINTRMDPAWAQTFDDPLIYTVAGQNAEYLEYATNHLERAVKAFESSEYQAYPRFHATVLLAAKLMIADTNRVAAVDAAALRLFEKLLTDGSLRPEEQHELAEDLVNGWGQSFTARNAASLPAIVRRAGTSFEWLALVIEGESHIELAWQSRGYDYAYTVTPEGWRGFEEHLGKARTCLTRAHELRPDLPLAACRMMQVALGTTDIREVREWFDAVVAAQPSYMPAWKKMLWALRPRWHGDLDSMLAFGITAASTKHYETEVPELLLTAIADVESELGIPPGKRVHSRPDLWPHLQALYEAYLADSSKGFARIRLRGEYAVVAYLAEQYDVARRLLEVMRWQPWDGALLRWEVNGEIMCDEVRRRTAGSAGSTEQDVRVLDDRRVVTAMEARLKDGAWVELLPKTNDLAGWKVELGKWQVEDSGSVTAHPEFRGHMIYSKVNVGRDFELMGSFEVAQSPQNAFQAGVVMGVPATEPFGWYGIRLRHTGQEPDVAHISTAWLEPGIFKPVVLNSRTNSFHVRFQNGMFTLMVNGSEVCKDLPAPNIRRVVSPPNFFVGLGARNEFSEAVIRYNSLKVRRLSPQ